jgi:hypothetical protein
MVLAMINFECNSPFTNRFVIEPDAHRKEINKLQKIASYYGWQSSEEFSIYITFL